MTITVNLEDIIEGMEMQTEFNHSYLDTMTGEIVSVTEEELDYAQNEELDLDELPDWQKELVEIAEEILETDRYIQLPDKFDIDEYHIMERFCLSLKDEKIRNEMYHSIQGKGAFRRFKEKIRRFKIENDWYDFRDDVIREIAREWCEVNDIDCV